MDQTITMILSFFISLTSITVSRKISDTHSSGYFSGIIASSLTIFILIALGILNID